MKNKAKIWICIISVSLFGLATIWGISIAKCEKLTAQYGAQFADLYKNYTMFEEPDDFKVLQYQDTKASVYYVTRGSGGDIVHYRRDEVLDAWQFDEWETVWSRTGSASGFVWPYIR